MLTYFKRHVAKNNNIVRPEDRLPMMIAGGALLPCGLFWFAWTAANVNVHFMVPTAAGMIIGGSMFTVFIACISYLIDVYLPVANSVMAANSTVRALFGASFPLFAVQMFVLNRYLVFE
jgi:MFS transporter, DHA1 family, multidrug resistance protein